MKKKYCKWSKEREKLCQMTKKYKNTYVYGKKAKGNLNQYLDQ